MATKQQRKKKTMKIGDNLGQQSKRSHTPKIRISNKLGKKKVEESEEADDHYDDKTCVLCCDEIEVFAKGSCDHVICFRCSSRMRALCEETYCAVCRHELKKVVFIESNSPFSQVNLLKLPSEEKFGIVFQNESVKGKFDELLMNICPLCKERKANFNELKRHVRQKHEKQYCDICVKNLKVFPQELRVYSRSELVTHRKTGDRDDKSYKGHPLCKFCNDRYYDNDELLLHLRRNHFWCHFCENDGKQEYYCSYDDLRSHFGDEHFLCEEMECFHEKYTSVFRSDIDLQAHRLSKHNKKLTKMAARQARQLNLEIDYGKRKTYKDNFHSDRNPRNRQETEVRRMAMNSRAPEENSETATLGKESVDGATGADILVSDGASIAEMNKASLDADAPEFVPSAKENVRVSSQTDASNVKISKPDNSKPESSKPGISKPEGAEKQWSHVISNTIGRDYGAEFPSIAYGGARPKTSLTLQETHRKGAGRRSKSCPTDFGKSQISRSGKIVDSRTVVKAPPGLNKDNAAHKKLPPGINFTENVPGTSSTTFATSAPPGLAQTGKNEAPVLESTFQANNGGGNVKERNAALVSLIRNLLNEEDFNKFRDLSGEFRRSEINASTYYSRIREIFGNNLDLVFSELVDLLPEREKQKQLLTLHSKSLEEKLETGEPSRLKGGPEIQAKIAWASGGAFDLSSSSVHSAEATENMGTSAKNGLIHGGANQPKKDTSSKNQSEVTKKKHNKDFLVCSVCGYPVSKKGLESHMVIHAELDFPALPTFDLPQKSWAKKNRQAPISNAWVKSA